MNDIQTTENQIQSFLTPESMLTPGAAGALTMMITNTIAFHFSMPRAWVGLLISFIFGLLVLVSARKLLPKIVYYILNSLIIFCVAVGANGLGGTTSRVASTQLINSAFAQEIDHSPNQLNLDTLKYCADLNSNIQHAQTSGASTEQILSAIEPCQNLSKSILESGSWSAPPPSQGSFFSPWKF